MDTAIDDLKVDMKGRCTFVDHTADRRMVISGNNMENLFRQGLHGLSRLLIREDEPDSVDPTVTRQVMIQASDRTTLLVDFLSEVLTGAHIENAVFNSVKFEYINKVSLKADIEGYKVNQFAEEVKAVTYHEAEVKKNTEGQWQSTIIFDI